MVARQRPRLLRGERTMKKAYTITTKETTIIVVENNAIEGIDSIIAEKNYSAFLIITDQTTHRLFAEKITKAIKPLKKPIEFHILPEGEDSKSIQQLFRVLEHLIEKNFDRKSAIIALGGGVIGDIATTASGTFLRGIDCIQIPTTLLSQVDAAIGGKGAVNLRQYKNVIGVIKQPKYIIIDPEILQTLPENQIRNGMGEVIKYAISLDKNLFSQLEKSNKPLSLLFSEIIDRCVKIKMEIVTKDPYDEKTGTRQLLNFGHTLGHAIELSTHIPHGQAVSIGMAFATRVSEKLDMISGNSRENIFRLLKKYHLPVSLDNKNVTKNMILEMMKKDKKAVDGLPTFVLLEKIGKAKTGCRVPKNIIEETLEEIFV